MPRLKDYRLFISHPWTHDPEYERLVSLLRSAKWFRWRNYSVPVSRPLPGGPSLGDQLLGQIRPVHAVLILAGMYANHREWIQAEMDLASSLDKPMIGVVPWRQRRVSTRVRDSVREMVHWNTASIVDAIRRHAL